MINWSTGETPAWHGCAVPPCNTVLALVVTSRLDSQPVPFIEAEIRRYLWIGTLAPYQAAESGLKIDGGEHAVLHQLRHARRRDTTVLHHVRLCPAASPGIRHPDRRPGWGTIGY